MCRPESSLSCCNRRLESTVSRKFPARAHAVLCFAWSSCEPHVVMQQSHIVLGPQSMLQSSRALVSTRCFSLCRLQGVHNKWFQRIPLASATNTMSAAEVTSADHTRGGPLYDYLVSVSVRPQAQLEELQQATLQHPRKGMLSPPDSIAILQMLAKLVSARNIIEVGVFTGYTTLGMALALPPDGKLIACDISTEFTDIGKPYWEAAKVAQKVDLRIAPATETLEGLLEDGREGTFDMGFIDADKNNYLQYYELLMKLLRPGGVIAIDNVLWGGSVIDDSKQDEDTLGIRAINKRIFEDERADICMLNTSDGISVARKR